MDSCSCMVVWKATRHRVELTLISTGRTVGPEADTGKSRVMDRTKSVMQINIVDEHHKIVQIYGVHCMPTKKTVRYILSHWIYMVKELSKAIKYHHLPADWQDVPCKNALFLVHEMWWRYRSSSCHCQLWYKSSRMFTFCTYILIVSFFVPSNHNKCT